MEVVWVMKHGHIGEAIFDLDAAQFLLEEMRAAQPEPAGEAAQHAAELARQRAQWRQQDLARVAAAQAEAQAHPSSVPHSPALAGAARQQPAGAIERGDGGAAVGPAPPQASVRRGTLGHAVGPTWVAALPHVGGETRVVLEYGANVEAISPGGELGAGAPGQPGEPSGSAAAAAAAAAAAEAVPDRPAPSGASEAAEGPGGGRPWNLWVQLTNGARYGVDLVISAIGVTPALDWVPPAVERGRDGGLVVDRWGGSGLCSCVGPVASLPAGGCANAPRRSELGGMHGQRRSGVA